MKKSKLFIIVLCLSLIFTGCSIGKEETEPVEGADIVEVTEDTFADTVLTSKGVVLVDFWAAWCGPCVSLAPILEEVSAEEEITVYKVNTDENPNLAAEYEINGIPAVYVFVDGEYKDQIVGLNGKSIYVNKINAYR